MIPKAPSSFYTLWLYCAESRINAHKVQPTWINPLHKNVSFRVVVFEKQKDWQIPIADSSPQNNF